MMMVSTVTENKNTPPTSAGHRSRGIGQTAESLAAVVTTLSVGCSGFDPCTDFTVCCAGPKIENRHHTDRHRTYDEVRLHSTRQQQRRTRRTTLPSRAMQVESLIRTSWCGLCIKCDASHHDSLDTKRNAFLENISDLKRTEVRVVCLVFLNVCNIYILCHTCE